MTPLTPEEKAAEKAEVVLSQLRGLQWTAGLLVALLMFAIAWGVSTIREQATHESRITALEDVTKRLQTEKETHEQFVAITTQIFDDLREIKAEQIRSRESSEGAIRGLTGAWSKYRSHR